MLGFDNLKFVDHPLAAEGVWASMKLGRCHVSVIQTNSGYSSEYPGDTYEVLVISPDGSNSLMGWKSRDQITALMEGLQLAQLEEKS